MSLSNIYRMHSVHFASGTPITQLTDLNLSTGIAELVVNPSGDVAPGFTGINEARPETSFSTQQIYAILAQCTTEGISGDLSGGDLDVYYRAGDPFATLAAESAESHIQAKFEANSILCWSTIRASQGGLADISCRLVPVYDGTNSPMQLTSGVAIADAAVVSALYTLGPIKLNGSWVEGVQDVTIDSGVSLDIVADSGSPWPTLVTVSAIAPRIRFTTRATAIAPTLGTLGTPLTALLVYLRKKSPGGAVANVADGTAEHVKFAMASGSGMAIVRDIAGSDGMVSVEIPLKRPSANTAVWTITQAAIT